MEKDDLTKTSVFEASKSPIRSVCLAMSGGTIKKVLVGTQTCDVIEFSRSDGFKTEEKNKELSKVEPALKYHHWS